MWKSLHLLRNKRLASIRPVDISVDQNVQKWKTSSSGRFHAPFSTVFSGLWINPVDNVEIVVLYSFFGPRFRVVSTCKRGSNCPMAILLERTTSVCIEVVCTSGVKAKTRPGQSDRETLARFSSSFWSPEQMRIAPSRFPVGVACLGSQRSTRYWWHSSTNAITPMSSASSPARRIRFRGRIRMASPGLPCACVPIPRV